MTSRAQGVHDLAVLDVPQEALAGVPGSGEGLPRRVEGGREPVVPGPAEDDRHGLGRGLVQPQRTVVARHQDLLASGRELDPPNGALGVVPGPQQLARGGLVDAHVAVHAAGRDQLAVGAEGDRPHSRAGACEREHELALLDVPDVREVVLHPGRDHAPVVRAELGVLQDAAGAEGPDQRARTRVPDPCRAVDAGRDDALAIVAEARAEDEVLVPAQGHARLHLGQVPDARGAVATGRDEARPVRSHVHAHQHVAVTVDPVDPAAGRLARARQLRPEVAGLLPDLARVVAPDRLQFLVGAQQALQPGSSPGGLDRAPHPAGRQGPDAPPCRRRRARSSAACVSE